MTDYAGIIFENNRHLKEIGKNFRQKKRIIGAVSQSTSPKVKQLFNLFVNRRAKGGGARVFCMGFGN